jgi:flagellar protein FlaG
MNYDLFIPAAAIDAQRPSHAAAAQAARMAHTRAAPLPDAAAPRFAEGQAALGLPRNSASDRLITEEVENTVDALNEVFEQANVSVRYKVDADTDDVVVMLIDRNTDEVLRQIPPEQILKMRHRLEELMGLLFDSTA